MAVVEQSVVRSLPNNHPNIVKFHDAGISKAENEIRYFILSEYCPSNVLKKMSGAAVRVCSCVTKVNISSPCWCAPLCSLVFVALPCRRRVRHGMLVAEQFDIESLPRTYVFAACHAATQPSLRAKRTKRGELLGVNNMNRLHPPPPSCISHVPDCPCLSIHLCISLSTYPSVHPSVDLSMHPRTTGIFCRKRRCSLSSEIRSWRCCTCTAEIHRLPTGE